MDVLGTIHFLAGAGDFSLLKNVQSSSGDHPTSYSMDTTVAFSRGKAARP